MKHTITERPTPHKRKLAAIALSAAIGLGASNAGAQTETPQAAEPSQAAQGTPTPQSTQAPQQEQQEQAASDPQQEQPDMNDLRQKFIEVSQRINAIQQQAIQDDSVKEKHDMFNTAMNEAVLKLDNGAKEWIDEQETLRNKILGSEELTNPDAQRSPEFMDDVQKYQALEQRLAPMRQQVAQEAAVVEKQKAFEQALISKMEEIDPETPQLLSSRDEIIDQYRQTMQKQQ